MSESANKAVFLSYARDDAAAARRIAEALRSSGIEVWFDENELRGGDTWDAKIRKQINDCTLFVAVISRGTESRSKGYFRLEWKLAVEQTHMLLEGTPFVVPMVIDDVAESAASVPPEFMKVQWTRLPGALPTPQFVDQVKRLLTGQHKPVPAARPTAADPGPAASAKSKAPMAILAMVGAGLVGVIVYLLLRPAAPAPVVTLTPVAASAATASLPPKVDDKSIAVLPFENMSDDKDAGFFADGIHEDLLTTLALVPELKVVSRTSVMHYRGTSKTIGEIGSELHVAYILEGSVRRAGNTVRVTGQLINTRTDEHVWAKNYDRDLTDVFSIQTALSQEIANALSAAISPQTQRLLERKPTTNAVAYDLYLRGRDVRNRSVSGAPGPLTEAETLFQSSVQQDPKFAAAWAELADVEAAFVFWQIDTRPERLEKGDAAIATAIQLAADDPDVIRSIGTYRYYAHRDYVGATEQYEKLARLQPNDATVFESLGLIQRRQGHWGESLANLRKAAALEPGNPSYLRALMQSLRAVRRWDEFRRVAKQLEALAPDNLHQRFNLPNQESSITGSPAAEVEFLAHLTPEERNSPQGLTIQRTVAMDTNDFATFKRLDQLPASSFADDEPGLVAAFTMAMYYQFGDKAALASRAKAMRDDMAARVAREPSNPKLWSFLSVATAFCGDTAEGVRLMQKAAAILPVEQDAVDGPIYVFNLGWAYAFNGDLDRSLDALRYVLEHPSGFTVYDMKTDPVITKAFKGDPRFTALVEDPKHNEPLY